MENIKQDDLNNEAICQDGNSLYSRGPWLQVKWVDRKVAFRNPLMGRASW